MRPLHNQQAISVRGEHTHCGASASTVREWSRRTSQVLGHQRGTCSVNTLGELGAGHVRGGRHVHRCCWLLRLLLGTALRLLLLYPRLLIWIVRVPSRCARLPGRLQAHHIRSIQCTWISACMCASVHAGVCGWVHVCAGGCVRTNLNSRSGARKRGSASTGAAVPAFWSPAPSGTPALAPPLVAASEMPALASMSSL